MTTDAQRRVTEPVKDAGGGRSPYERDRARVLHSAAFRRLAAKTQVHTAGTDDFLRTRLTHSLEVAQIAREMGARLGCDPDVVDTAGLAHDLGHPPFGHNGEAALNTVAAACGGFEGNAQTLRVLTRLEAKVYDADGTSVGLNLTRACLDAVSKYPWPRRPGRRKFGVYADDRPVFDWLRHGAPPGERRCLEAQVMDWADDVAYSVHDVEDGIHGGYLTLGLLLADADERAALCADVAATYSAEPPDYLGQVLMEVLADPLLAPLAGYDGSHRAQAALKATTSVLTGRFVADAVAATTARFGPGPHRRYAADLVVPRSLRARCALLKGIALRYVMRRPGAQGRYQRQREIITDLVRVLTDRAPDALDPVFAPLWRAAGDDASRLRVVIDQVASLTDPAALAWHARLTD
ncbi:deoxyguanosinetriphosphate triphosphohydrolase [Micromonospora fiedleri]|uniref:Deoxyguanosinetriphosphate triphosphohydrolase-like protein n=1 Tax=Micromonospora fiedleri TaxID=1157498 RepID=A0ABS1UI01_9ACTN|nr:MULTISPECIES: deoxyguanosinetriphosphate triphosphohydrolase [Micromonospora]MBL6275977.1 deoxyguanosinetriphosphate triphosphohydrolase [Micromonospora fiedleri]WSK42080.1 deoxyguanosinetriphosphate triphosphohydrolase [Micromonospora maris]